MKLKQLVGTTLATSLMLCGCSNKSTSTSSSSKQEDGKYVLASVDDTSFLADDFYDNNIGTSTATSLIYQEILLALVNQKCPVNDDMQAELDTLKETYQQYVDAGYESYLLSQIQNYGYNTLEEYYEGYLQYLQVEDFFNSYIDEHYDEIFEDYMKVEHPKKVYHILVKMADSENPTEEELAKVAEVQSLLEQYSSKDGFSKLEAFKKVATDYSDDSSASEGGYLGVCGKTQQDNFVTEFSDMMDELAEDTYSEAFKTQYGYHIMYIEPTSEEDLKKELDDPDSDLKNWGSSTFYDSYLEYVVFDSYDITYGDETVQANIESFIQTQLDARAALRTTEE